MVRPVPGSAPFTDRQIRDISRAVSFSSADTGLHFSVFLGDAEGEPRPYAERLLAAIGDDASKGVLVLVAPGSRNVEIVTGPEAGRRVPDRACALATLSMTSAFEGGDLVGGIVQGVRMLADAAGRDRATI